MTCKDCYHYSCHKHWYDGFEDFDSRFNDTNVEILCPEFKDKSKIIELPCNVGDTVYQTDTVGERIYPSKIKNIIFDTDGGFAFDQNAIGKSVFLTREAVKKKLEELKKCQ